MGTTDINPEEPTTEVLQMSEITSSFPRLPDSCGCSAADRSNRIQDPPQHLEFCLDQYLHQPLRYGAWSAATACLLATLARAASRLPGSRYQRLARGLIRQ